MACMLCQQKLWMTNPTFVTKLMTTNRQISSLKSNAHRSCSSHRFLNAVKFQLSVTNGDVRHMLPFIKPYSSRMSYHNTKCYKTKQQCGGEQMGLKEIKGSWLEGEPMKVAASSSGDMETNEAYAIRARGLNGSKFGSRQGRKIRGCSKARW